MAQTYGTYKHLPYFCAIWYGEHKTFNPKAL